MLKHDMVILFIDIKVTLPNRFAHSLTALIFQPFTVIRLLQYVLFVQTEKVTIFIHRYEHCYPSVQNVTMSSNITGKKNCFYSKKFTR